MLRPFSEVDRDFPLITSHPLWNVFNQHNMAISRFPSLSVDLVDCDNKYCVQADLPGMNKENIHISIQGRDLKIEGERREFKVEENSRFRTQERFSGKFVRTLQLPDDAIVDPSKLLASYKDGVLQMEIPKKEDQTTRQTTHRINVQ